MGSYEQIQDLGVFDRLKLNEKLYVIRKYLKAMPLEGDSAPAIRATKEQIAALQDIYDRMLSLVGRTRETAETVQMHKVEKERNRLVNSVVRRVLALRKSSLEKERLAASELYNAVVDLKGFYRQTRIDKMSAAETVQQILAEPQYAEPVRILGLDKYEAELERLIKKYEELDGSRHHKYSLNSDLPTVYSLMQHATRLMEDMDVQANACVVFQPSEAVHAFVRDINSLFDDVRADYKQRIKRRKKTKAEGAGSGKKVAKKISPKA